MHELNLNTQKAVEDSVHTEGFAVLRSTYKLLSMTLLFSSLMTLGSMFIGLGHTSSLAMSLIAMGLIFFVLPRVANTEKGLVTVFAITGLLGASLGPTLNYYLGVSGGGDIVFQALLGTAVVFFSLSIFVAKKQADFSKLGGFLLTGLIVAILAMIGNIFLQSTVFSLAISSVVILLMSGFILHDTSEIIHGRQTNYILATISIYLSLYNLFISFLSILGITND